MDRSSSSSAFLIASAVLVLLCMPASPGSTGNEQRSNVKEFDKGVLELQQRSDRGDPHARRQAADLLRRRATALRALISESPAEALRAGFPEDISEDMAKTFPESADSIERHSLWEGTAEHLVFDEPDLVHHRNVVRIRSGADVAELYFEGTIPPSIKSGHKLRVSGMRLGDRIAVKTVQIVDTTAACCGALGAQTAAVILVTFPNLAPPVSAASMTSAFFGPGTRSLDGYWREASYGKTWLSGTVHGWYTLDQAYTCDQFQQLREAAIRAADPEIDFRQIGRLFIVFPNAGSCSWAGLSTVGAGTVTSPQDGSFTASTSWLVANYMPTIDRAVQLAAHEGGHGLGLNHASSADYGDIVLGPVGATASMNEYGDTLSAMGSWNLGHYAAPHKAQLGWIQEGADYLTLESSATLPLQPLEVAGGTRALRIRRGSGNDAWLWFEYRQPIGDYDSTLPATAFTGALAHYSEPTTGTRTNLLDFTPATVWSDPTMRSGANWQDPYTNTEIRTDASSGSISVAVSYGPVPCVRSAPYASISPANQSAVGGESIVYTLTVSNRDNGDCGASAFTFTGAVPEGWSSQFGTPAVTLAPGQSAATTWTVTPATAAPLAVYSITANVSGSIGNASAQASCTVKSPPEPLTISLAGPQTVAPKSSVSIAIAVSGGTSPLGGRTVTVTFTKPTGAVQVSTVTTNASGAAVWKARLGPKDPPGQYGVRAEVRDGAAVGSATAIFVVR